LRSSVAIEIDERSDSGIGNFKPPLDTLKSVAEAIEANRLFGKEDVQARDVAFQSTQPAFDFAEVFSTFALGIEHLLHHLHEQI
jgi:hypothetical protein